MMLVAGGMSKVGGMKSFGVVGFFLYMGIGALYFYPALKLSQYASRIAILRQTRSERDLARALEEQRAFWAFCGIMTVITLALYAFLLFLVAVGGMRSVF
tara:strand:- start:1423 stop:1722 length:300 start_codon:yes stop_codon:yes gene_type:complete